jgi:hypothetical protein
MLCCVALRGVALRDPRRDASVPLTDDAFRAPLADDAFRAPLADDASRAPLAFLSVFASSIRRRWPAHRWTSHPGGWRALETSPHGDWRAWAGMPPPRACRRAAEPAAACRRAAEPAALPVQTILLALTRKLLRVREASNGRDSRRGCGGEAESASPLCHWTQRAQRPTSSEKATRASRPCSFTFPKDPKQ